MSGSKLKYGRMDWWLVGLYLFFVLFGWMNIYSSLHTEEHQVIFDFSQKYGMQFVWILTSFGIASIIMYAISSKVFTTLPPLLYFILLLLLFSVIFLGKEINGSKSWFALGPVSFQPAEVSKITTSLLLAYIMCKYDFSLSKRRSALMVAAAILLPMMLIVLEKETGSALVYAGFLLVFYLVGMSGWVLVYGLCMILLFVTTLRFDPLVSLIILNVSYIIASLILRGLELRGMAISLIATVLMGFIPRLLKIFALTEVKAEIVAAGILFLNLLRLLPDALKKSGKRFRYLLVGTSAAIFFIFSVEFIFENILQPHQKARIENLLGIKEDLMGVGYNVHQSKIAIGSGGFLGKGYLQGTQTKFNFVPEQSTDFIFCTIGEEWGFLGAGVVVVLYMLFIGRLILSASGQRDAFTRIYGWCIAAIFFMHVFINVGMTIGLVPVIGIPLPFISYGGSSLWTFTTMLFIYLRLDLEEKS